MILPLLNTPTVPRRSQKNMLEKPAEVPEDRTSLNRYQAATSYPGAGREGKMGSLWVQALGALPLRVTGATSLAHPFPPPVLYTCCSNPFDEFLYKYGSGAQSGTVPPWVGVSP